jgi:8-oxo-dGTP pyrophosphatase MutT (NUDIX family)
MLQRYTVFLNDKAVIISYDINISGTHAIDTIVNYSDLQSITTLYQNFCKNQGPGNLIIVAGKEFKKACSEFNSLFRKVNAAGGIVKNLQGEYLFIKRNERWDLPKGKLHKKESIPEGALREVWEETGLTGLIIEKELSSTFHIYTESDGSKVLKETFWFAMASRQWQNPIPQTEEGITEVRWFPVSDIGIPLQNTFASLKHFWKQYIKE